MRQSRRANVDRAVLIALLICREEVSALHLWYRTAERSTEFVEIEIRVRIRRLRRARREIRLPDLVAQVPSRQGRVLVVVEQRPVILRPASPRSDANVRDPRVLRG